MVPRANRAGFSQDVYQYINWEDPEIKTFMQDFVQTRSMPLMSKFIEQGKKEGYINLNLSMEAVFLYLSTFNEVMDKLKNSSGMNEKVLLDMGDLLFYGLPGKLPGEDYSEEYNNKEQ